MQIVAARCFRVDACIRGSQPNAAESAHAFLNIVPRPRSPGQKRRRYILLRAFPLPCDRQSIARHQGAAALRAINLDQGLGKQFLFRAAWHRSNPQPTRRPPWSSSMVATSSPLIAGLTRLIRALTFMRIAKQKPRDIKRVDAQVLDDEALAFRQIGLAGKHVIGRAEGNAAPERLADRRLRSSNGFHALHGRLPAEILMHHQWHAWLSRTPRPWPLHRPMLAQTAFGKSRLTHGLQQVQPKAGALPQWWRYRRNPVFLRPASSAASCNATAIANWSPAIFNRSAATVADRDDLRALHIAPAVQMVDGKKSAANQCTAQHQVILRIDAVISSGSNTRFQSSRISTGLPNWMALLQASENTPAVP